MFEQKSLKHQNVWLLNIAVLLHVLVFLWVIVRPIRLLELGQDELFETAQSLLGPGAISLGVICILRLVLLGMLPSALRDSIVHWRVLYPLPGSRAFTKYGKVDPRVDMKKLETMHSSLPIDPEAQDRLFYAIYRKHKNETGVLDAHKSYLAMREISVLNLLFLGSLSPLAGYVLGSFQDVIGYVSVMVLAFVSTCYAAQQYGRRMVENVLAAESAEQFPPSHQ